MQPYSRSYYGRGYTPRAYFSRPYYSFRPRLSLGFGLFLGFPTRYPYYPDYAYPYGYSYGYPPAYEIPGSMAVVPSPMTAGGVSLEITPDDAAVYVDGTYVGPAGDFGPSAEPLTLSPGRHHIEILAPGYLTMAFDTDVLAGEVLPYRGAMQPQY